MATYAISHVSPSKYGDGDRWRIQIDGEWYDAYLTPEAGEIQPGDHEVEFKTSPKTGKHYIVAVDGRYRTTQRAGGVAQRPQAPAPAPRAPSPVAPAVAAPAPKSEHREMWIMATSILQAVIAQGETGDLVELAKTAATAARAAARVFDAAPVDAARAALEAAPPAPAPRGRANPPQPEGDPADPRNTGPDFDDDIPF
jgi:hypothetical protein